MIPHKFIPPKDDDFDYNPAIEQEIEDRLFSNEEQLEDIHDTYKEDDCDDLKLINIG
jgi:hypothetical protein